MHWAASVAVFCLLAAPVAAGAPVLSLPVDCTVGETCFIQHFVDRDPTAKAQDFNCGTVTYDGHKGTDIAIPTTADMVAGVPVLASAPGVVAGLRDGMPDVEYSAHTAASVKGRECGNGVVIRHGDGWETQYCHLRSGSLRVHKGERVDRGAVLGLVGMSGKAQFPHLHLGVRHNGQVIDPFDTDATPVCGGDDGPSLWDTPPPYTAGGLVYAGFSTALPQYVEIKAGTAAQPYAAPEAPALILFGFAFGGRKGDVIRLSITGPNGAMMTQEVALEKDQAQFFRAGGKRLRADHWPSGRYSGTVSMLRGGDELDSRQASITIP